MQIVYYFEEPIIGYCPDCDVIAMWTSDKGLVCPKCHTQKLSVFKWDETSRHPEEDPPEEDEEDEDE